MNQQSVDTVILGASCWSAGQVLQGADVLVIDRNAGVGTEYFDSFRAAAPYLGPCRTAYAEKIKSELAARGQENDFHALAPFLYAELKTHHPKFRLWTEVTAIRPENGGWLLELCDVSGVSQIVCKRLIDTTPECRSNPEFGQRNIRACRSISAFLAPETGTLPEWQNAPFSFRQGRRGDEFFAVYEHASTDTYPEVRKSIIDAWRGRPAEWREAKIITFSRARDFDVNENEKELGENYFYLNANQFDNALSAIDSTLRR